MKKVLTIIISIFSLVIAIGLFADEFLKKKKSKTDTNQEQKYRKKFKRKYITLYLKNE